MIKTEHFLDDFSSTLKNSQKLKKKFKIKTKKNAYFDPPFWRIFAHFEKWILTLKSYNSKTTQQNLKSYTSKFMLDYPLSNKSIFRVVREFIRSHEADKVDKRPKLFLDHPVEYGIYWVSKIRSLRRARNSEKPERR